MIIVDKNWGYTNYKEYLDVQLGFSSLGTDISGPPKKVGALTPYDLEIYHVGCSPKYFKDPGTPAFEVTHLKISNSHSCYEHQETWSSPNYIVKCVFYGLPFITQINQKPSVKLWTLLWITNRRHLLRQAWEHMGAGLKKVPKQQTGPWFPIQCAILNGKPNKKWG